MTYSTNIAAFFNANAGIGAWITLSIVIMLIVVFLAYRFSKRQHERYTQALELDYLKKKHEYLDTLHKMVKADTSGKRSKNR